MSTTTPSRGDVVFVSFQFTSGDRAKNRPAVVVSSAAYHSSRRDVLIAGITSNFAHSHFVGRSEILDWKDCGLNKPSVVSGIVMTIRDWRLGETIGRLSMPDQERLNAALRDALGL